MLDAASPLSAAPVLAGAQRSFGRLDLAFSQGLEGRAVPRTLRQEGALKVRLPTVHEGPAQAIVINTAGGLTGGDRFELSVAVEPGAALCVSGQACEKLYKAADDSAKVSSHLSVGAGASLEWLMQPAIIFDHASFVRTMTADVAGDGRLLAVEALVFGRTAMAEQVHAGRVAERWRIRRDGKLVYADALRLDGDIQGTLDRPFVLDGHCAVASLLYVGTDAPARCADLRAALETLDGCTGAASAWNGILSARLVAPDGYALTRGLVNALSRFRTTPLPRPWMI